MKLSATISPRRVVLAILLVGAMLGVAAPAKAALVLVTSRGALGGTDFVDWGLLGPAFTQVSNPFTILSNGGVTVDVSKPDSSTFERRNQSTGGWAGNFAFDDHLLWTSDSSNNSVNPIALFNFDGAGIDRGGAQIQADFFGAFVARIEAFDVNTNSLGFFDVAGNSSPAGDNSAIFIGVISDIAIHTLKFSIQSAVNSRGDFAINQFDFNLAQEIPEPTTLALCGLIGAGLMGYRLRRRQAVRA